jgi:hypothetical protein
MMIVLFDSYRRFGRWISNKNEVKPKENHQQGYHVRLIEHHNTRMYAESEVELHTFLSPKLDGELHKK